MDLALQVAGPYQHVLDIAHVARDGGAVAISLPDHYLYGGPEQYTDPAYDSFVQAAGLARDTEDLEVVMLVSPITFRHPAFYAKAAITIDEMSGGRFVLGIGAGWNADEHEYFGIPFPEQSERFRMLEDALGYLRQLIDHPDAGFESERYRFAPLASQPRARTGLRILVGGSGEHRTPSLAGAFAGEYSIAGPEPDAISERISRAHAAAVEHDRDPGALLVSASEVMLSGHSQAGITKNLGQLGAGSGQSGSELRTIWEGRGLVFRTWEEHLDRFGRYADGGIGRMYLQLVARVPELAAEALANLAS